jgi:hypothetical protein
MRSHLAAPLAFALVMAALPTLGRAQDAPKPEAAKPEAKPAEPRPRPELLRVQIVLSRLQGERKIASVPYTLLLTSDARKARLRMGVEMPVAVGVGGQQEQGKPAISSIQYRNVGTSIDCWMEDKKDGLYQLSLNVESSSVFAPTEARTSVGLSDAGLAPNQPLFRTFNVGLNPTLRDGQSVQAVASTDPVTGEVVKIDVTMNVVR